MGVLFTDGADVCDTLGDLGTTALGEVLTVAGTVGFDDGVACVFGVALTAIGTVGLDWAAVGTFEGLVERLGDETTGDGDASVTVAGSGSLGRFGSTGEADFGIRVVGALLVKVGAVDFGGAVAWTAEGLVDRFGERIVDGAGGALTAELFGELDCLGVPAVGRGP